MELNGVSRTTLMIESSLKVSYQLLLNNHIWASHVTLNKIG
jgi:hypothetical protein